MAAIGVKFADIPEMFEAFMEVWSMPYKMKVEEHRKYEPGKAR